VREGRGNFLTALQIQLFGACQIIVNDKPTRLTTKQGELLALLVLEYGKEVERRYIWEQMWGPESNGNLRRELFQLQLAFPDLADHLVSRNVGKNGVIRLKVAGLKVDVLDFDTAAKTMDDPAALEQALRLYNGDLVPDSNIGEIIKARIDRAAIWRAALANLAYHAINEGEIPKAISLLSELVQADALVHADNPFESQNNWEVHCRTLMAVYANIGDLTSVQQTYREFETRLSEVGKQPAQETVQAYRNYQAGKRPRLTPGQSQSTKTAQHSTGPENGVVVREEKPSPPSREETEVHDANAPIKLQASIASSHDQADQSNKENRRQSEPQKKYADASKYRFGLIALGTVGIVMCGSLGYKALSRARSVPPHQASSGATKQESTNIVKGDGTGRSTPPSKGNANPLSAESDTSIKLSSKSTVRDSANRKLPVHGHQIPTARQLSKSVFLTEQNSSQAAPHAEKVELAITLLGHKNVPQDGAVLSPFDITSMFDCQYKQTVSLDPVVIEPDCEYLARYRRGDRENWVAGGKFLLPRYPVLNFHVWNNTGKPVRLLCLQYKLLPASHADKDPVLSFFSDQASDSASYRALTIKNHGKDKAKDVRVEFGVGKYEEGWEQKPLLPFSHTIELGDIETSKEYPLAIPFKQDRTQATHDASEDLPIKSSDYIPKELWKDGVVVINGKVTYKTLAGIHHSFYFRTLVYLILLPGNQQGMIDPVAFIFDLNEKSGSQPLQEQLGGGSPVLMPDEQRSILVQCASRYSATYACQFQLLSTDSMTVASKQAQLSLFVPNGADELSAHEMLHASHSLRLIAAYQKHK
jgi:DNA-binding SARP family transcriptional activator